MVCLSSDKCQVPRVISTEYCANWGSRSPPDGGKGESGLRILISQEAVERRVAELAAELDRDYAGSDGLVAIGILKGSVFFMADLLKRMTIPLRIDFFQTASYGSSTSPGEVRIRKDIDLPI